MKKMVGIIGQFPPPIHGLSKALDTLYTSHLKYKYKFVKFDITNNKKFLNFMFSIIRSNLDIYYFTISQSKFGNIRDLIILKVLEIKKKKIIIHLHGGGFRNLLENDVGKLQKKINYKILRDVDCGIVLGESLKNNFKGIIDDNKIKIVRNCVDDKFVINNEEFKSKLNKFKNKQILNILYLGNFMEDKGYKEVLKLALLVKDKNDKRFRFLFAGKFFNEKDKFEFKNFINKNDLSSIVSYKGGVYGNEKKKLLEVSDYFILLTRYKKEGQPISIIEAAANGLRVISTNHAGIRDILNSNEMILCNENNICINKIYSIISKEYYNKLEICGLLINNRKKILKDFSQDMYIKNMDSVFRGGSNYEFGADSNIYI